MLPIAVALVCFIRFAYLLRPVEYSRADETVHLMQCRGLSAVGPHHTATPMRQGYFLLGRLCMGVTDYLSRWRPLSAYSGLVLLSTLSGCVTCVSWGRDWRVALAIGSSPLLLGLGRRALSDVPLVAVQCLAVVAAPHYPWVSAGMVVLALWVKESSFSALPGLALWVHLAGGPWWPFVVGAVAWLACPMNRWEHLRWLLPHNVRRVPNAYAARFCLGGWLRLVVDLCMMSAPAAGYAVWTHDPRGLAVAVILAWYGCPWLHQQIRSCLVVDVLLRVMAAPIWPLIVVIDLYVWYRVYWRGQVYDPAHADIAAALGFM